MESGFIVCESRPEEISNILFQGHDKMFLKEFGSECRYEWLPVEIMERCFGRLDRLDDWMEDYRSVGKALGIQKHQIGQVADDSNAQKESVTNNVIKRWCQIKNRKMTIGMLHTLLTHLSLNSNVDALVAIEEVLQMYPDKRQIDSEKPSITIAISEFLLRWRLVLKR
ncbi:uncharacterized protein [Amphiura filiformis]|uniref:uncharacterized protein n=1 Tax=Amphiura filiformis TaxID=82378 RepID=UPI003B21EB45